jgi:uncharacterized protein (TIGR02145 family)
LGSQVLVGNTTCANEYISVTGCGGQTSLTYDGSTYDLVEIGGQCWFADNLATDQYRNGDPIPTGLNNTIWENTTQGAYVNTFSILDYDLIYGKLYNWYAINDSRSLCPLGWHVPSDCEWMYLEGSLGMILSEQELFGNQFRGINVGGAMKSPNLWNSPNIGASNSSDFNAIPGGDGNSGDVGSIGYYGYWWSSSEFSDNGAWNRVLHNNNSNVWRVANGKSIGFSVRCLRD